VTQTPPRILKRGRILEYANRIDNSFLRHKRTRDLFCHHYKVKRIIRSVRQHGRLKQPELTNVFSKCKASEIKNLSPNLVPLIYILSNIIHEKKNGGISYYAIIILIKWLVICIRNTICLGLPEKQTSSELKVGQNGCVTIAYYVLRLRRYAKLVNLEKMTVIYSPITLFNKKSRNYYELHFGKTILTVPPCCLLD